MENTGDFVNGNILDISVEDLKESYLDKLNYDYTLNWFDSEFYNYTGFDVFSKPFDKEKGFSIYEHRDIKILVIKLEKLNVCYATAMKAFLGLKVKLEVNVNQSNQKPIYKVYKELRQVVKFSQTELDEVYSHKYVTHFYSDEEKRKFILKDLKTK
jgi:hypothetical protein